jgi:uncharacterized membrane protein YeaQ/YmgE (transglycosylase-associated protein family)
MTLTSLLIFLVVGAIAGWLASMLVRGGGLGLIGDIVVGVVGSFIGGWLFAHVAFLRGIEGVAHGNSFVAAIIGATIGAIVLLLILRLVRRL